MVYSFELISNTIDSPCYADYNEIYTSRLGLCVPVVGTLRIYSFHPNSNVSNANGLD